MRKELSFKHLEEPEKLTEQGIASEIFEFKPEKGKKYVFKELGEGSTEMKRLYPGETLEEKASLMKEVYNMLKEQYGDNVVNTHHIIAKNKEGKPCIMIVQEKIDGVRFNNLGKNDSRYEKVAQERKRIIDDIPKVVQKIEQNSKLQDCVVHSGGYTNIYVDDIAHWKNLLVDKKGDIKIVDW